MPIGKETEKLLIDTFGADSVRQEAAERERYGRDETPGAFHPPDLVVLPRNGEETATLLRLANEHRFPVIPRGAGTGVVGGAIPFGGGVVLSLERMNRIVEIDEGNMMAVVEPAVITGDLQREVESKGLFYPPDPASLDSCSIGGNVATGAGGPRAVKYGVTRDYVCGLEAVLPSGETVSLGGKIVKYATGYHLLDLLIGSEGTLAVITAITLRLIAFPGHRTNLLVPFDGLDSAAGAVAEIIRRRLQPAVLESKEKGPISDRHTTTQAIHLADVLLLAGHVDRPGTEEERDLAEGVHRQMHDSPEHADGRKHAGTEHHISKLADG